ncbi:nucleotidyltransferase domain-containing protein [bacterium]|nr:nucleotidyltransferase domain-containing protein [bacterium]
MGYKIENKNKLTSKYLDQKIKEEIANISRQIVEKYKPEKIILFGSAAKGEFGPDSDVDFLVIKKDVPYYGIDRMLEIRRLIKSNIAMDLLVYLPEEVEERAKMGDPFVKTILKEGMILYG